jgi:hypothetical protein
MTWEQAQLTTQEAERALRKAGIPLDPTSWDEETVERATMVLDTAQDSKIRRLQEQAR